MRHLLIPTLAATFIGCLSTTSAPSAAPTPRPECGGAWQPQPAAATPLRDMLDKRDIVTGMGGVNACVQACAVPPEHWYSSRGMVVPVAVTIAPTGQPSARVVSSNIAQPIRDCIVAAVNRASFPPFSGAPISFVYPYLMR